ncbi:MAG: S8 family serine peptidase [Bacteroidota bacterium]
MGQFSEVNQALTIQFESNAAALAYQQEQQVPSKKLEDSSWKEISARWNIWTHSKPTKELRATLELDDRVLGIQENVEVNYRNRLIPNDPQFNEQWNMNIIQAPEVWSMTTGGQTVDGREIVVAIIDTGCDVDHQDLKNNIWANPGEVPNDGLDNDGNGYIDDYQGWNFETSTDEHPDDVHGSSITGIIGAEGDNAEGIAGVNWKVKVLLISNANSVNETIAAYDYIADLRERYNESNGQEGAYIVVSNASFGIDNAFEGDFPVWCGLYDDLGQLGILNTVAVTNLRRNIDATGDIPARCPSEYVLTVTNTDQSDEKVRIAGWGDVSVDMGAPGDGSLTTNVDGNYSTFGGTSTSVAHVSGAAALLYTMNIPGFQEKLDGDPALIPLYIKRLLMESVDPLPSLDQITVTGGRLNIFKAAQLMIQENNTDEQFNLLKLFPNPAGQRVELLIANPEERTNLNLEVFDAFGKLVLEDQLPLNGLRFGQFFLDTGNYSNGVYVIRLSTGNFDHIEKFIVLN